MKQSPLSIVLGFAILFAVYHFPEFFSSFWISAVCKIGFLFVAALLARLQGLRNLGSYGLNFHEGWSSNLLKGILFGVFFYAAFIVFCLSMQYEKLIAFEPPDILKQLPLVLLMTLFPSVAEDILTRGYIFTFFKRKLKPAAYIIISSVIYVLNHIWRYSDGPAVLSYLFLLGIVLAYAVWITRSLWLAFGIHWATNIVYESSRTIIKTVPGSEVSSTWILAAMYLLLFCFLFLTTRLVRYSKYRSYR